ncbi:MAG: hypothetical protein ACI4X9_01255 [Kiritimatiellia bacterium]
MNEADRYLAGNGFAWGERLDRRGLVEAFREAFAKGLAGAPSSLAMIPTYVADEPLQTGPATLATLDMGGTNFRSGLVHLPTGEVSMRRVRPMPGTQRPASREEFYGAIAEELQRLLPHATDPRIGFCFSYSAQSTEMLDARLGSWEKGVQIPEVVGDLLGAEIRRRTKAGPVAIVNDAVTTLLAARCARGCACPHLIGFILGTGTNVSCAVDSRRVSRVREGSFGGRRMIVNVESAGFDWVSPSAFDEALWRSLADGDGCRFEKMISGAYLGPLVYLIWRGAAEDGLFSKASAERILSLGGLSTPDADGFVCNPPDAGIFERGEEELARELAVRVFERSAELCGAHLAAIALECAGGGWREGAVGIHADGSTFYKTRGIPFASRVARELGATLGLFGVSPGGVRFLPPVADAPMVGAALAAATLPAGA